MEQTAKSEEDGPQAACIHITFNRPEVFCNTALSDSVCLCFCNGFILNRVTGNIQVHQIVSDNWQQTLSTKGVLAFGLKIPWTP